MASSLVITPETAPAEVLALPKGQMALGIFEVDPTPDNVAACAKLIAESGGHIEPFYSQSGVVVYAGNNLGWGQGSGYQLL